ncbi:hypothetical protein [Pontibacter mangrovi]|uniref:STAS/SEC14 domain-containing protein n=1 Tax=Pontibacter mangrovi TaxID=2589816 RepID=A0A501WBB8_9BACT|nr:hypothetical protein [Pontibacter mangrovi]TPE44491.1 hypothetical protein FJM65_10150 [Pontibacter mangrovi]
MAKPRTIIFNEPELLIYTDPANQVLVVQANGVVPSHTYRQGMQLATDEAINKRYTFWLINNRAGGIITPNDQIWANEVTVPQLAAQSCITKMAIIEPEDLLSHIILEGMMDKARESVPFEMQFFERVENAYEWFRDGQGTFAK